MTEDGHPRRVELYVRSLLPAGTPDGTVSAIRKVQSLSAAGTIETASVTVVGRGVIHDDCCLSTACGAQLLDTLGVVEQWADRNDATVPGIETSTVEQSAIRERSYTMTTVPQCLLLEYTDGELSFVSPSTVAGTHWSVEDHLNALADGHPPVESAVTGVSKLSEPADRPEQSVTEPTAQLLDASNEP